MFTASDTIAVARQLIREQTVSPEDGGCQQMIGSYLEDLGFTVEHLPYGRVKNLWATLDGQATGPLFAFAGHTDVVPPGPLDAWEHPPFAAHLANGILYGRGAADMKGSLAAMLTASRRFLDRHSAFNGTLAFLVTSDEEDLAIDGTVKVVKELSRRGIKIDHCVLGEPSSSVRLGDVVRRGRRGSLNGELVVKGIQGHVAYPLDADNPIHSFAPCLSELAAKTWDAGNSFFPATSFQVSNINAGTGASNLVPGELRARFNFRFSTDSPEDELKRRTETILQKHGLDYELDWHLSGNPFITKDGRLISAIRKTIRARFGYETELSTAGGTSDGRFIAPTGAEVVEIGPCNATIHQRNERVSVDELEDLSRLYTDILRELLTP